MDEILKVLMQKELIKEVKRKNKRYFFKFELEIEDEKAKLKDLE